MQRGSKNRCYSFRSTPSWSKARSAMGNQTNLSCKNSRNDHSQHKWHTHDRCKSVRDQVKMRSSTNVKIVPIDMSIPTFTGYKRPRKGESRQKHKEVIPSVSQETLRPNFLPLGDWGWSNHAHPNSKYAQAYVENVLHSDDENLLMPRQTVENCLYDSLPKQHKAVTSSYPIPVWKPVVIAECSTDTANIDVVVPPVSFPVFYVDAVTQKSHGPSVTLPEHSLIAVDAETWEIIDEEKNSNLIISSPSADTTSPIAISKSIGGMEVTIPVSTPTNTEVKHDRSGECVIL